MTAFVTSAGDLAAAGRRRAVYLAGRNELVILTVDEKDDGAAVRTIERQLPVAFRAAPWTRIGPRVAVWAPEARRAAEALFARNGARMWGAAASPSAFGLDDGADPLWLVRPTGGAARASGWAAVHRRSISVAAAVAMITGIFCGGRADREAARTNFVREETLRRDGAARRARAVDRLNGFADALAAVPTGVQLLDLSIDGTEKRLRLRGRAADFPSAARTRSALAATGTAIDVVCGRAFLVKVGTSPVIEFSVEGRLP